MKKYGYYFWLYLLRGTQMVWRNLFSSITLVLVLSLLLFVVYIFTAMSVHTHKAADKVQSQLVITATIKQDPKTYRSLTDPRELVQKIQSIPGVKGTRIISEEETRERFLKNVQGLKAKPAAYIFQEAIEISVDDVNRMKPIQEQVQKMPGVDKVNYLAEIAEKLTAVSSYIKGIALGGAVLLTLIAIFVVIAVVRSTVHQEERAVTTMASVGGSWWTIAFPLMINMFLLVLVSGLIASVAGWYVDPQLGGTLGKNIANLPEWLRTGRAFSFGTLLPLLVLGASLITSLIVSWSTFRYSKNK